MELNLNGIKDVSAWSTYKLPSYDLQAMRKETFTNPAWLHFGSGNIFRAFIAAAAQRMLNAGITDTSQDTGGRTAPPLCGSNPEETLCRVPAGPFSL